MTTEQTTATNSGSSRTTGSSAVKWTRLEEFVAGGTLLASLIWFLGVPTGMAIDVGFGAILLLDSVRSLVLDSARSNRAERTARGVYE